MKTKILLTMLALFPILASAQYNNMQMQQARNMNQQMKMQNQRWASERAIADQQSRMRSMMTQSLSKIEIAEKKLAKEEKNKKKAEEKAEKLNVELKTKQDELAALENKSKDSNDAELQKNIEKSKKEISKTEEKLATRNSEIETSSNKTKDYKNNVGAAKLEKEALDKKNEKEKKQKQMEKELKKKVSK